MESNCGNNEKKLTLTQNYVLVFAMAVLLFGLAFCCWFKKEDTFSQSERRLLKAFPKLSMETVLKGEFMKEFESYTLDQFPFRDQFRSMKAMVSYGVFGKKDNNDIYMAQGHLSKMEYPMDTRMLDYGAERIKEIYDMYLKEQGSDCYFSIVPDKNFFLAEENGYLSMDYEAIVSYMQDKVDFARYIDVSHLLTLEDYYRTDTHWRQEKIVDVAEYLKQEMNAFGGTQDNYEIKELKDPFYGVYYGQAALPIQPDTLYYLESDVLRKSKVISYDTQKAKETTIYNMEKAKGNDPYEIFLSGTSALQVIENPMAETEKELVVFRDSFGSSLIPLMVDGYSKITVVDTRYVQSKMLGSLVDFHGQDVLFIYSTMILNNSMSLR